jgi:hypothetical protein
VGKQYKDSAYVHVSDLSLLTVTKVKFRNKVSYYTKLTFEGIDILYYIYTKQSSKVVNKYEAIKVVNNDNYYLQNTKTFLTLA